VSDVYCPYCGSISKPGDPFCNNCGASIDVDSSPSSVPQTQIVPTYQQPVQAHDPFMSSPSNHQYGSNTQATYVQTTARPQPMKNQAADLSLVFALIGFFVIPGIGGLLAIIFGIIGLSNPYNRSKAIIGLVLGLCQTGGILFFFLFMF